MNKEDGSRSQIVTFFLLFLTLLSCPQTLGHADALLTSLSDLR